MVSAEAQNLTIVQGGFEAADLIGAPVSSILC